MIIECQNVFVVMIVVLLAVEFVFVECQNVVMAVIVMLHAVEFVIVECQSVIVFMDRRPYRLRALRPRALTGPTVVRIPCPSTPVKLYADAENALSALNGVVFTLVVSAAL